MSLISGSNSLTLATAGALDFRAGIVEKGLLDETVDCNVKVCSKGDGVLVGLFALKLK